MFHCKYEISFLEDEVSCIYTYSLVHDKAILLSLCFGLPSASVLIGR